MFMYCIYSCFYFFLMLRRPPRSTHCISSAASDVYKRQPLFCRVTKFLLQGFQIQYFSGTAHSCELFLIYVGFRIEVKFIYVTLITFWVLFLIQMTFLSKNSFLLELIKVCLLYTSPSPRDQA
eukprot:TRINITY_DN25443_c0_g1_i1.p2 TRINITY_DN25443_c0_g1~~TRINITY_DN25443_c0_g1_i1.p2  ORF type:complete len:123 (+),score=16.99 TRINITY_DN25443_c0_g1_i1:26-394(+)